MTLVEAEPPEQGRLAGIPVTGTEELNVQVDALVADTESVTVPPALVNVWGEIENCETFGLVDAAPAGLAPGQPSPAKSASARPTHTRRPGRGRPLRDTVAIRRRGVGVSCTLLIAATSPGSENPQSPSGHAVGTLSCIGAQVISLGGAGRHPPPQPSVLAETPGELAVGTVSFGASAVHKHHHDRHGPAPGVASDRTLCEVAPTVVRAGLGLGLGRGG